MLALGGKHVPNLNPSVYWVTSPRPGSGRFPEEAQVMPWELKVKKGPPNPVGAWPSPACQALGIKGSKRKLPSGHHSSRPLGGRLSGLETAGFGGGLQEPRLWAPRNSRDSPRKRSSHLPSFPSASDRGDKRDQCPVRPLLKTRHQGG